MYRFVRVTLLISGLLLSSMRAMASPAVDYMSDMEVSEYAIRMSEVLEKIHREQLCMATDDQCVREECARNGVVLADKDALRKRLHIMIGSIN